MMGEGARDVVGGCVRGCQRKGAMSVGEGESCLVARRRRRLSFNLFA